MCRLSFELSLAHRLLLWILWVGDGLVSKGGCVEPMKAHGWHQDGLLKSPLCSVLFCSILFLRRGISLNLKLAVGLVSLRSAHLCPDPSTGVASVPCHTQCPCRCWRPKPGSSPLHSQHPAFSLTHTPLGILFSRGLRKEAEIKVANWDLRPHASPQACDVLSLHLFSYLPGICITEITETKQSSLPYQLDKEQQQASSYGWQPQFRLDVSCSP